jgi:hypothetical protein
MTNYVTDAIARRGTELACRQAYRATSSAFSGCGETITGPVIVTT